MEKPGKAAHRSQDSLVDLHQFDICIYIYIDTGLLVDMMLRTTISLIFWILS